MPDSLVLRFGQIKAMGNGPQKPGKCDQCKGPAPDSDFPDFDWFSALQANNRPRGHQGKKDIRDGAGYFGGTAGEF